jgi:hypothetical protein
MPKWIVVGDDDDGEPVVVVNWVGVLETRRLTDAVVGGAPAAIFTDRWAAKRVVHRRNEWRNLRVVRAGKS